MGIVFHSPIDIKVPPGFRPSDRMMLARCWGYCFAEEFMYPIDEHTPVYYDYPTITAWEVHKQGWRLVSDIRFCSEENKVLVCSKCVERLKLESQRLERMGWA